jgi:hypothetical protein
MAHAEHGHRSRSLTGLAAERLQLSLYRPVQVPRPTARVEKQPP